MRLWTISARSVPRGAVLAMAAALGGCAPDFDATLLRVQAANDGTYVYVRGVFDVVNGTGEQSSQPVLVTLSDATGELGRATDNVRVDPGRTCLCVTERFPRLTPQAGRGYSLSITFGQASATQPLASIPSGMLPDCSASCYPP